MKLKFNFSKQKLLLFLCFITLSNFAIAQRTITGTITDAENGDPLIGASIMATGTSTGTISDIEGTYSIKIPETTTSLNFSYTGFSTQTIALSASNVIDVKMSAGSLLDEVVVIGYGSIKKSDATGAVTSVSSEDFNGGVISSPEQLIQGRAAGVQITSSSGEPGAGINIRIRGTSSVRSDNNPLFVVDGVPLSASSSSGGGTDAGLGASSARNPLNFINPNDIASIDILKDASATAIYGSRGANGVVIITTKSGKSNSGKLDYSYALGSATISKKYDLLGKEEYLNAYETFNPGQRATQDQGGDTDWQDEIFRTAFSHNHNLSFGEGSEDGNYRFSVGYLDQEGIIETSGLKRLTGRFNSSKKFLDDRLKIGTQVTIANTHDDNVAITDNSGFAGDLLGAALKANPSLPVRDANGELNQPGPGTSEPNPVAILELSDSYTNTLRALGNISAELQLFEGLSFKTVVGLDRSSSERKDAFSRDLATDGVKDVGRLFTNDIQLDNKLWENYFTYTKESGSLNFTGLVGYSYQSFDISTKTFEFTNFRTSDLNLMLNNFASADQSLGNSIAGRNSSRTQDELQSYFGRLNFGIADKYLLTLTMRADGSTRFGGDNKYGYFPSAAFKWRLIEEDFVPDFFDDLGLRLGYGVTGNQELPHNAYQQRLRYGDWDIDNGGSLGGGGLGSAVATPNPSLKWETTSQFNIGLDFAIVSTRVSGSLDYYRKDTKDLLFQTRAAQPSPSEFIWENLDANVINQGIELGLNIAAVTKGDLRWDVNANVAYNKNEVTNFSGLVNTGEINGQGLTGAFAQRIAEGQPLFAFFLRDFGGYDDKGITIYNGGDVQKFVGASPLPSVIAGLTNNFSYKGLDLSIFLNGQFGQSVYSNTANAYFTAGALANGRNVSSSAIGNLESNLNAPDVSTRFLENASFVRLQNITLGYNIDIESDIISRLRLYITGQNLAVFTDYSGQDPEVNTNKSINGVPSAGIDYTPFPRARTFTFGANVSF